VLWTSTESLQVSWKLVVAVAVVPRESVAVQERIPPPLEGCPPVTVPVRVTVA
jgi:hypothetical protein